MAEPRSGDANGVTTFNFLIIGQGLAGTALAWHLRWRGFRVLVLDRGNAITSSRIQDPQLWIAEPACEVGG